LETNTIQAPLFSRVKIPSVQKVVQGSLFNEESLLLRESPSPAVDEAWERLAYIGVFFISSSEVRKLGKDPLKTVKAPPSWGKDAMFFYTSAILPFLSRLHYSAYSWNPHENKVIFLSVL
jgi:hypothetical protein